jgi:orotate phosphoribosyltransferase
MFYRSVADLNLALVEWHSSLPDDLELIVGVPRSGLLAGTLLALHMNLPVADVDGLLAGRVLGAGTRYKTGSRSKGKAGDLLQTPRKVLLLEDYVLSGRSLQKVRARIEAAGLPHTIEYGSVYADPARVHLLDHHYELVTPPTYLEWNIFHHPWMEKSCISLEGVLCHAPTYEEYSKEERYGNYVAAARPLMSTTKTVGHIIASRPERYRAATEVWLAEHGIGYHQLHMFGGPADAVHGDEQGESDRKARIYTEVDGALFFEHSADQAHQIARKTGRYVFCTETRAMVEPGSAPQVKRVLKRESSAAYHRLQLLLRQGILRLSPKGGSRTSSIT